MLCEINFKIVRLCVAILKAKKEENCILQDIRIAAKQNILSLSHNSGRGYIDTRAHHPHGRP